ncbi:MAG: HDOD domain-containing protein [Dehalococcoidia bacterium]|nr:MAG: HDOD domain-containing protein [Dehalococcoidia bacterium]
MPLSASDVAARAALKYPMPAVMYELLALSESATGALAALPGIIALDPDLQARMAIVARGPGPWSEHTTTGGIDDHIRALGFRRVHSAALLITAIKALPIETAAFDYLDFWRYSLSVAYLVTPLAYARLVDDRDQAFAAGLFHDVGRLILEENDPQGLTIVRSIQLRGEVPWHEVERSAFGFTALELSVEMARAWRFPAPLIAAISGLIERRRTGLAGALRDACLAARALRFATATGRRQAVGGDIAALMERIYEGEEGLRLRVNSLLETSMIAPE